MVYILIVLLGLALGSFTNALAWRIYEQSITKNKAKLKELSVTKGRSMCVHCKHELSAVDLIPVFSWVILKGKCRYCHKKISWQYPLVEIVFVLLLLALYHFWPLPLVQTVDWLLLLVWLPLLVIMLSLAVIDIRHQVLPTKLIYAMGVTAAIYIGIQSFSYSYRTFDPIVSGLIGGMVLFGLFYAIYQLSKGQWVGGGDVRLVAVMGLLLGWQKGLLALLVASYFASALMIILVCIGGYHKKMRIPFGPFLLLATVVCFLFGGPLIQLYRSMTGL